MLGKKTGWDEYWEARKSLDAVLKANPKHVRARVARGWIDYIVDTRMPWGTRWVLGGGNKKKGLTTLREAAAAGDRSRSATPKRSSRCGTCCSATRTCRAGRPRWRAASLHRVSRQPGGRGVSCEASPRKTAGGSRRGGIGTIWMIVLKRAGCCRASGSDSPPTRPRCSPSPSRSAETPSSLR